MQSQGNKGGKDHESKASVGARDDLCQAHIGVAFAAFRGIPGLDLMAMAI